MIKKLEKITNKMSLLYVDDNQELCDVNMVFFKDIFQNVDFALNGEEALALYDKKQYDLVITDINMPKLNGFSLIKEIYKNNPFQVVIVVSAYSEVEYLSQLNDLKVDYFLVKPVDTKKIIEKIYECVTIKEVQD